jgi:hypothetical protein
MQGFAPRQPLEGKPLHSVDEFFIAPAVDSRIHDVTTATNSWRMKQPTEAAGSARLPAPFGGRGSADGRAAPALRRAAVSPAAQPSDGTTEV